MNLGKFNGKYNTRKYQKHFWCYLTGTKTMFKNFGTYYIGPIEFTVNMIHITGIFMVVQMKTTKFSIWIM